MSVMIGQLHRLQRGHKYIFNLPFCLQLLTLFSLPFIAFELGKRTDTNGIESKDRAVYLSPIFNVVTLYLALPFILFLIFWLRSWWNRLTR